MDTNSAAAAVTVYSLPNCVQCNATHKKLTTLGIEHQVVDMSADPAALAAVRALGYQQAPVVMVQSASGDLADHWSGFRLDKIKALAPAVPAAA